MDEYYTGLIVGEDEAFPRGSCRGAGWEAVIAPHLRPFGGERLSIVLHARSHHTAQRALELIWEALHILNGDGVDLYDYPEVYSPEDNAKTGEEWKVRSDYQPLRADRVSHQTSSIPLACVIAARASRKRRYMYAMHLLALSKSLAAVHCMDLDPSHWKHRAAVSPYGRDHVRCAYAIMMAYACIEQLGLEIRASASRPSTIKGKWNAEVRQDLETRLRAAGVNLEEPALWVGRGTLRRVEAGRPARALGKQPWSEGMIRDLDVDVVDAIAHVSWLRSKVSAHVIPEEAASLTRYDVDNAQYLSRRLLLSTLRAWRYEDVVMLPLG